MASKKATPYLGTHILLIIGSVFMLFPFVWMISTSFKSESEVLAGSKSIVLLPDCLRPSFLNSPEDQARIDELEKAKRTYEQTLSQPAEAGGTPGKAARAPFYALDNYRSMWKQQNFYRYFLNTFFIAITTTAMQLFFASMAAYSFAFFKFPLKDQIFLMMLGTMMIPQQALLIPDYIILSSMGWVNTYLSLIVPWAASAYSVFFLRQFFLQLPKDLYEAAVIDGCTKFQFYYKVVLPLSIPSMVTLGIFSFLASWNSFVWPLIVTNDESLRVIQVGLSYFSSEAGTAWGPLMAASTVTIVPLVLLYFFAQSQFVESQAMTGMKE